MEKQNGELVDNLIYEAYKDKILVNGERFKENIKRDYGFVPSSALYRKIINYQIKKYGNQLDEYIVATSKYFSQYGSKGRRDALERRKAKSKLNSLIKRNEKNSKYNE